MITDDDITKLKGVLATKDALEVVKIEVKRLSNAVDNVAKEQVLLRQDLDQVKEKVVTKDDLRELRTLVEKGFGEILKHRDEQLTHAQRHDDTDEELRHHSQRLDRIESVPSIAHSIKR